MMFLAMTGFDCGGADVLRVIKFVFKLLDVVLFIIPMVLIVMVSVDLVKNVISGKDDDMKRNLNVGIKRIIYCCALFLIEPIVSVAISLLGNVGVDYASCIEIAKTHDLSKYEIDYEEGLYDVETPNFSDNNGISVGDNTDSEMDTDTDTEVVTSKYIKLNETLKYLKYKNTFQLKATLSGVSGDVTWTSSNTKVAEVDSNGKVTAKGGGLAIITATVDGKSASCKIIAIRYSFEKTIGNYRTKTTLYYDGNKKITYYFRRQNWVYACDSEKVNGKQICTSGFRTWYANHGCGTIATTAVVNAYKGNDTKNSLISAAKMRMVYEKNEYNWKSKYDSDYYCNKKGNLNQMTRLRVSSVLNNQFGISSSPYTIASQTGNEAHIERITNALAEGRPVIIFVNANQAGTKKFTSGVHTLVMVGFADEKGHVIVLDSSHNGFKEDSVEKMVNQYIGRGTGKYRGYVLVNEKKG